MLWELHLGIAVGLPPDQSLRTTVSNSCFDQLQILLCFFPSKQGDHCVEFTWKGLCSQCSSSGEKGKKGTVEMVKEKVRSAQSQLTYFVLLFQQFVAYIS